MKKELQQAIDELVLLGLIIDSGRRRNGQIVYVTNPAVDSGEAQARLTALDEWKNLRHRAKTGGHS
jgi:hypothetical protein